MMIAHFGNEWIHNIALHIKTFHAQLQYSLRRL